MPLADDITALATAIQFSKDPLDDATRTQALKAARDLVQALEHPAEIVTQKVAFDMALIMALRMGIQLGAFQTICNHKDEGVRVHDIAEKSGASPTVVGQILRLLASKGYIVEADVQTYKPSALTHIMADPAIEAGTRSCFDLSMRCSVYASEYFHQNGNQFPPSVRDTPFQLSRGTQLSFFEWLGENPSRAKDFQQGMTASQQKARQNWVDWFDVEGVILNGFRKSQPDAGNEILFVDVGGGQGQYLHAFNRRFPDVMGRRILQDLPHVISSVPTTPNMGEPAIEVMAHDVFKPQPVKGARVYYMHWILHDWADEQARDILANIAAAMEPGYSRLIINEHIIPDRGCSYEAACLSVMMMIQVGGLERTEQQWRELLNSVGLTDLSFHQPQGSGEGIIVSTK
ncbi:sterigmatocystin 8-O-methyltransferase precursor [Aspergillus undulatus]|uniref:sterigmatocystin 8-O-methyltransferase precursor n=1 Tax=Aspergillus undulatus TaxID=1810928 RepID=UPI003CCE19FF